MERIERRSSVIAMQRSIPRSARRGGARRAFTLIELLVVVAIIAVLMAILLPSLSRAREQARMAVCGSYLRALANGFHSYFTDYNDWIPGMNTSGVALSTKTFGGIDALQVGTLPVQTTDWVTPLLRYDTQLPTRRAKRFELIVNKYKCPSQIGVPSELYGSAGDKSEFQQVGRWSPLSYLMPVHFQFWGQSEANQDLAPMDTFPTLKVRSKAADPNWEAVVDHYTSRVDKLGQSPARKVCVADGNRYVDNDGTIDFDINPFPTSFGAFTSAGAWWSGSTSYGVRSGSTNWGGQAVGTGSASNGANLRLTYRHLGGRAKQDGTCHGNPGRINAMFFDGHVDGLNDKQSRKIDFWYPTGARVKSPSEGMTVVENNYIVQ